MTNYTDILDFWFLPKSHPDHGTNRMEWFQKNDAFDAEIKNRFADTYQQAKSGELLNWCDHKEGTLALIIVLDQFPRNMFRGTAEAFATDGKARELANHMIDRGFFEQLSENEKIFAALPFEHSEDLDDQLKSVAIYQEFATQIQIDYALKHKEFIERFGRFPHRNAALGRDNTAEETAFLKTPGSSF